jgi:glycosyltransferase involved in cell wall biosynthesis
LWKEPIPPSLEFFESEEYREIEDICRPLFDKDWYVATYTDVINSEITPLQHYITIGANEGRDPSPYFKTSWYLSRNGDVREAGINPLYHYGKYGGRENRDPHPHFDALWYSKRYPEIVKGDANPLAAHLKFIAERGYDPNPLTNWFANDQIVSNDPAQAPRGKSDAAPAKIGVVYLARSGDGDPNDFAPFLVSYRKYWAGVEHDLIIVRKGEGRSDRARKAINVVLAGIKVRYIDIDDVGYDIQAYLRVSHLLKNEYLCFLNTFSEIKVEGWLSKLMQPFEDPQVGLAGATASYESIQDSVEVSAKAVWLATKSSSLDPALERLFAADLARNLPDPPQESEESRLFSAPQFAEKLVDPEIQALDSDLAFKNHWTHVIAPAGSLAGYDAFDVKFPNPHLRSNGFIIKRDLLLDLKFRIGNGKWDCILFESGRSGLSARLAERGLKSILVGADGRMFEVDRWPESGTFRLGDQSNVMISDNRVREFDAHNESERERLAICSWGEYLKPTPDALKKFGYPFKRGSLDPWTAERKRARVRAKSPWPKISVVIPTHNRLALVKEALVTIRAQTYENWDCIVYDNGSSEPIAEHIDSLRDPRVQYAKSDSFVPVTDSWNGAIDRAEGDYIILIGDDDGFVPNAFERIQEISTKYSNPDFIYTPLVQFIHPGVSPGSPWGHVDEVAAAFFFLGKSSPFILRNEQANFAVTGSLQFRRNFSYNMQACIFSGDFLKKLRRQGKVFHSPFPDYYLANLAMLQSTRTVVFNRPIGIQGVSRKSFGFTLFNNMPARGASLLATDLRRDPLYQAVSDAVIPVNDYNTNFMVTMHHVFEAFGEQSPCRVNMARYRKLQIYTSLGAMPGIMSGEVSSEYQRISHLLSESERAWAQEMLRIGGLVSSDDRLRATFTQACESATMYASSGSASKVTRLATGEFGSLPDLFVALRTQDMKI